MNADLYVQHLLVLEKIRVPDNPETVDLVSLQPDGGPVGVGCRRQHAGHGAGVGHDQALGAAADGEILARRLRKPMRQILHLDAVGAGVIALDSYVMAIMHLTKPPTIPRFKEL